MSTTATLQETLNDEFLNDVFGEATVKEDLVENVCLCGNVSKNDRNYPASCFEGARIYEGRPVFLDHRIDRPKERSVRDLAGTIRNARMVGSKPYGDIAVNKTDAGRTLLELAGSHLPPGIVGMSHNAKGRLNPKNKCVEQIQEVASVDVVCFPATTSNFKEHEGSDDEMSEASKAHIDLLEKQVSERDDKIAEFKESLKSVKDDNEKLTAELKELQENHDAISEELEEAKKKIEKFEAESELTKRREWIAEALKEAGIDADDEGLVSQTFHRQLMAESDDDKRQEMIDDRAELLESFERRSGDPGTRERKPASDKKKKGKRDDDVDVMAEMESCFG